MYCAKCQELMATEDQTKGEDGYDWPYDLLLCRDCHSSRTVTKEELQRALGIKIDDLDIVSETCKDVPMSDTNDKKLKIAQPKPLTPTVQALIELSSIISMLGDKGNPYHRKVIAWMVDDAIPAEIASQRVWEAETANFDAGLRELDEAADEDPGEAAFQRLRGLAQLPSAETCFTVPVGYEQQFDEKGNVDCLIRLYNMPDGDRLFGYIMAVQEGAGLQDGLSVRYQVLGEHSGADLLYGTAESGPKEAAAKIAEFINGLLERTQK